MTRVVISAPGDVDDPRAAWLAFLASPAAPKRAMSVLALDGYLTGILVAPGMIPPSRWMANLWIEEEPVFDDEAQLRSTLGALGAMSNALGNRIQQSLRRLEADRVCDYRPGFLPTEGKPSHAAVREWIGGFWKAMELVPAEWSALILDERTRVIVEPFVGFIDLGPNHAIERPDDIEERLDDAAAMIPRAILLLRKLIAIRAARNPVAARPVNAKVGRNDPCSCGSGQKFKRCCRSV